jgi:hypothetical protein
MTVKQYLAPFLFALGLLASPAEACSVHDHNCQFHSIGRAVNPNVDPNAPTAVYIVTEASNGIDFDNNVLLPDHVGPYIASGTTPVYDPNQPYLGVSDQPRHVYPGQPQIDFNANTAQAIHSGDFNGAVVIAGATGCQYSVASNCEEVKIFGNIPDPQDGVGFVVRQTNYLYNYFDVPNPSVELQSYAVATGSAFIRTYGHQTVYDEQTISPYSYDSLNAANPTGSEKTYYIGFYGFDPHAQGVDVAIPESWKTYGSQYSTQVGNTISTYQDVTLHSQQKMISASGDVSYEGYTRKSSTILLGTQTIVPPKVVVSDTAWQDAYDRGCRNSDCSNLPQGNFWTPNSSTTPSFDTGYTSVTGKENPNAFDYWIYGTKKFASSVLNDRAYNAFSTIGKDYASNVSDAAERSISVATDPDASTTVRALRFGTEVSLGTLRTAFSIPVSGVKGYFSPEIEKAAPYVEKGKNLAANMYEMLPEGIRDDVSSCHIPEGDMAVS